MRAFQAVVFFILALVNLVAAQDPAGEATTTSVVTSTIVRSVVYVSTEYASGTPTTVAYPTETPSYPGGNSTYPTGTGGVTPSPSATFDAATGLFVPQSFLAVVLAGMGLLAI